MASIDQIIQREVNPFDTTTFKPGNFWQEQQDPALNINSIHQEAIATIENILAQIAKDHRTRTIMLSGDSGSGKSHLLGRLKQALNPKAFFVYIGPWADSNFIWRHTLRQTVDSLLKVPEGQQESQLLLWLKSLSLFKQRGIIDKLLGDRKAFIHKLKVTCPSDMYNANEFFGVLYNLLNPELHLLACDWLRGDDLDADSLEALGVKNAIVTEDAAQNILANFGKISAQTQPIVLCFDQLDNIPRTDGFIDLQALFSVNSSIHNQSLKNFLIIISVITNTWRQNASRVQSADRARIDASVSLRPIKLDEAEAIWKSRLFPLHQQADESPVCSIYPLKRQVLDEKFPGGKTFPRNTLILGRQLFQLYKLKIIKPPIVNPHLAAFQLLWSKELKKIEEKITRIRQLSSPELIQMLREALEALELKTQPRFLPSPTYTSYSLSYLLPQQEKRGLVWMEDPNMSSFFYVMKGCHKAMEKNHCQTLFLIRSEKLGSKTNQGYQIYKQIFKGSPHCHIVPDLTSVRYLATYHSMVNAVSSQELVILDKIPDLKELQAFVRDAQVLQNCSLLQVLGVLANPVDPDPDPPISPILGQVKEFLMNLVTTQQLLGRNTLIQNALDRFSQVSESQVEELIQQLCQENKVQILDPKAKPEAQLVCLVPNSK